MNTEKELDVDNDSGNDIINDDDSNAYLSESSYEADELTIGDVVWKCEFCKKVFKSEPQFDNHLKSKKHKDTVKKIQKQEKNVRSTTGGMNNVKK